MELLDMDKERKLTNSMPQIECILSVRGEFLDDGVGHPFQMRSSCIENIVSLWTEPRETEQNQIDED